MTVREVLARRQELALVLGTALRIEPTPSRVELQERVLDEMTLAQSA
ncbi:MAG TPA: hypothetical protein VLJ42_01725 [Solirubrobacteraceae bacterium]|nr:hypothetical protein [Solirubrobacteraceae bacterium]